MTNVESTALHESVYSLLKQQIISGDLKPGARIVESQVAGVLKVSRTPLREALFKLEQESLVESSTNRGFKVCELSAREAREVYPVLWTLEALALEQSGDLGFSQVERLAGLNDRFKKAQGNPTRARGVDSLWHRALIERCPNAALLRIIEDLRTKIARYESIFMKDVVLTSVSVKQHRAVIEALEKENLEGAMEALKEHWRTGLKQMLLLIGEL